MISVSTQIENALSDYNLIAVSFLTLDFPATNGGSLLITEAPRDVTVDGRTFSSSDNLLSVTAPNVQSSVTRDRYMVSFSDNDYAMRDRFGNNPAGVPLTVELGFIDTTSGQLLSELMNVYKGQSANLEWGKQRDGYVCKVGFTGQLTQLNTANPRMTTPESQQRYDATDQSMRYVHDTAADAALKWGKK
jgi:hypothetical protein